LALFVEATDDRGSLGAIAATVAAAVLRQMRKAAMQVH
jgi:hypothetical protein